MMSDSFDYTKIISELVQKNIEKIVEKVSSLIGEQISKFKIDFGTAFNKYLCNSYEKYSKVKTLIYRTEPKYLYDFFVCNNLQFKGKNIDANDIGNVLDISNFVIVQGTGGIGKSIMMKHFFLNELKKEDLIPVFIELKDFNDSDKGLYDCVYDILSKFGFSLDEKYLDYALKTGCFLFLLDGYDEVAPDRSKKVLKEIDDFCDKYKENYFIISSRPMDPFVPFQKFSVLNSEIFSKDQSIRLIEKIEFDTEIKKRFLERLAKDLYEKHKSFASNPLLLNIMLLTFDNYADIPEKLHLFYSNAFDTLYSKHDATKSGFKRNMKTKLKSDEFKMAFAEFCFRSYIRSQASFSLDELRVSLSPISQKNGFDAQDFIDDLKESVCVLFLDGVEHKFTHRSFQEYFVAFYINTLNDEMQRKVYNTIILKGIGQHDTTFDMLFDISPDKYERNLAIPILKKVEAGAKSNEDKYVVFLRYFAKGIHLTTESLVSNNFSDKPNPDSLSVWLTIGDKSYFYLTPLAKIKKNYSVIKNEQDLEYEKGLFLRVQQGGAFDFDIDEVISDPIKFNFVKNSWIGERISIISNLLESLEKKHGNEMAELDSLLGTLK